MRKLLPCVVVICASCFDRSWVHLESRPSDCAILATAQVKVAAERSGIDLAAVVFLPETGVAGNGASLGVSSIDVLWNELVDKGGQDNVWTRGTSIRGTFLSVRRKCRASNPPSKSSGRRSIPQNGKANERVGHPRTRNGRGLQRRAFDSVATATRLEKWRHPATVSDVAHCIRTRLTPIATESAMHATTVRATQTPIRRQVDRSSFS